MNQQEFDQTAQTLGDLINKLQENWKYLNPAQKHELQYLVSILSKTTK